AITVNTLPNVTAAAVPNEICNGGSSTLQGTGATSYLWMPLNIFGSPMVFPNVTTTYTVTGTAANGCTATVSTTLNVVAPPIITQQPSAQVSVNGSSAQFTVQCNNPNVTYIWQRDYGLGFQNLSNGGQYSGVNTNTLTISNLTQAQNGNFFRCQVGLPGCNVLSDKAILKVDFALGVVDYNSIPIAIYPNPATSTLHISTPSDYLGSKLQLRDMSGRICYETTLRQEETEIPVASWARGVYMLQVQSATGHWVYRVLLRD
ncbi:MAG: T9SS type A sorting domain-containing protein, partial [Chitinophagaceae bacterium]|nr:T9SS type A sorting domain-containing protein [Chitinophagaceae bacterium]